MLWQWWGRGISSATANALSLTGDKVVLTGAVHSHIAPVAVPKLPPPPPTLPQVQAGTKLATKTHEAIQAMRSRVQVHAAPVLSGSAAVDADAVFAEKDQVIQALNAELQTLRRKNEEHQATLKEAESKLQKDREQVEKLTAELR